MPAIEIGDHQFSYKRIQQGLDYVTLSFFYGRRFTVIDKSGHEHQLIYNDILEAVLHADAQSVPPSLLDKLITHKKAGYQNLHRLFFLTRLVIQARHAWGEARQIELLAKAQKRLAPAPTREEFVQALKELLDPLDEKSLNPLKREFSNPLKDFRVYEYVPKAKKLFMEMVEGTLQDSLSPSQGEQLFQFLFQVFELWPEARPTWQAIYREALGSKSQEMLEFPNEKKLPLFLLKAESQLIFDNPELQQNGQLHCPPQIFGFEVTLDLLSDFVHILESRFEFSSPSLNEENVFPLFALASWFMVPFLQADCLKWIRSCRFEPAVLTTIYNRLKNDSMSNLVHPPRKKKLEDYEPVEQMLDVCLDKLFDNKSLDELYRVIPKDPVKCPFFFHVLLKKICTHTVFYDKAFKELRNLELRVFGERKVTDMWLIDSLFNLIREAQFTPDDYLELIDQELFSNSHLLHTIIQHLVSIDWEKLRQQDKQKYLDVRNKLKNKAIKFNLFDFQLVITPDRVFNRYDSDMKCKNVQSAQAVLEDLKEFKQVCPNGIIISKFSIDSSCPYQLELLKYDLFKWIDLKSYMKEKDAAQVIPLLAPLKQLRALCLDCATPEVLEALLNIPSLTSLEVLDCCCDFSPCDKSAAALSVYLKAAKNLKFLYLHHFRLQTEEAYEVLIEGIGANQSLQHITFPPGLGLGWGTHDKIVAKIHALRPHLKCSPFDFSFSIEPFLTVLASIFSRP